MGNMNVTVIDQNNVKIAVTPTPTQTISIDRGLIGPQGISGISGYSGYSGYSGISGYSGSGISGYSGYSGQQGTSINVKGEVATVQDLPPTGNQVNDAYIVTADGDLWIWDGSAWFDAGQIVGPQGFSGISGFSGFSGWSGYSGFSGISGYSGSGVSGYSGDSGISGYSGWSGESGYSGISGFSGDSGISGFSGDSGISGYSGYSGISGYSGSGVSGWSGESGYSGYSGISGYSGYSGISGQNGSSGFSGFSGYSGAVGQSGYSGISGYSGFSGISGQNGASGFSGTSGYSGYSGAVGTSGFSGTSGWSGFSGISGYSGYSGAIGQSSSLFLYYAEAVQTSGQPATGFLLWNTATQSNATQININHMTNNGDDIDIFLALLQPTQKFTIQDQNVSGNYQSWLITGTPTNINPNTSNSYWTVPVSLISSGGTGTTDFADNHPLFLAITAGVSGTSGYSGYSGFSGISGWSGISGASGISGYSGASGISGQNGASGYSGISGASGFSGISGYSGFSGISGQNGASGYSGYSGISGTNGASGFSGYSGISGISGYSGFSGYSGISGYSGSGISGYSGYSGISGYSGYSGITPTIGGSNTQVQFNNSGVLGGSSGLTWDGSFLTTSSIKNSALTSGRVTYAGASGLLSDSASFTFDGATLTTSNGSGAAGLIVNSSANTPYLRFDQTNAAKFTIGESSIVGGGAGFYDFYAVASVGQRFWTGATQRMTILSTGNVGIGTSSPATTLAVAGGISGTGALNISGSGWGVLPYVANALVVDSVAGETRLFATGTDASTHGKYLFFTGTTNGTATERMRIDSSGNVGIGVSNPTQLLQLGNAIAVEFDALIAGTRTSTLYTDNSQFIIETATNINMIFKTNATQRMLITGAGLVGIGTSSPTGSLEIATSSATSIVANSSNPTGGWIEYKRSGTTYAYIGNAGALTGSNTDDLAIQTVVGKSLRFQTNGNNTRMMIDSSGNVGINETSPSSYGKLAVYGGSANTIVSIKTNSFEGTYYAGLNFITGGQDAQYVQAQIKAVGANNYSANLVFSTQQSGTTNPLVQRMTILSGGNVGIGIDNPVAPLNIMGLTSSTSTPILYLQQGGTYPSYGYTFKIDNVTTGNLYLNRYDNNVDVGNLLTVTSSGNLGIGTTTANSGITLFPSFSSSGSSGININHVSTAASGEYYVVFQYNASVIGYISQNGTTAVAYNTTSDYRLKENIVPMTGALATVAQLNPVTYKWKTDGLDGQGFIAHELQAVVPDCVTGKKDAVDADGKPVYQGVDTSFLVATLTKAIQEQQALIESLTTRLTALENK